MNKIEPVETRNILTVKNAVRNSINNNSMMAVVARVGSGKTTIFNWLSDYWNQTPQKFRVITIKAFDSPNTRIGAIMKFMIEKINPDIHVPGGLEKQYRVLSQELANFTRNNSNRVILMIDEAQDMNNKTFRDIKKIHEITGNGKNNLFSVILFGKPHNRWNNLYADPELGYRINIFTLDELTQAEILTIAEKRFNLTFESEAVRKRFTAVIKYKTPLGVEFFAKSLKRKLGLDNDDTAHVNAELVLAIPMIDLQFRAKQAGLKQSIIAERCREVITGKKINEQRVSEFFNNKISDPTLVEEMTIVIESFIDQRLKQKHRTITGKAI